MRIMTPLIYLFLCIFVPASMPTLAHAKKDKYKMEYSRMDRNHDGIVTINEWRGEENVFHASDWNGDGVLSGDEVTGGFRRGNDYDRNHSEDRFSHLDKNKDNIVSLYEWDGLIEAFGRLDDNRDGGLNRKEFVDRAVEGADRFTELDIDRDGYISRNEWHDKMADFKVVDKDSDGQLTRKEFSHAPSFEAMRGPFRGY